MTDQIEYDSHAGLVALWRGLPRPARALILARMVNRVGGFSMAFLAVLLTEHLHASVRTAGLVVAAFGLMTVPSRLAGGALLDRVGARRTIVLGLVGCAAGQLVLAGSPGLGTALLGALLLGLSYELIEPPTQALVADVSDDRTRPALFGLLFVSMTVAAVLAGAVAAVVAGLDLRLLFVIDAASCLACAVVVRAFLPAPAARSGPRPAGARPWQDPRLRLVAGVGTLFTTTYMVAVIGLPVTVLERHVGLWVVGAGTALGALVGVAAQRLLRVRWLAADAGARAMVVGYLVLATGLLVVALAHAPATFLLADAVVAVADVLLMSHLYATVSGLAPEHARGRYLAVFGLGWGLATTVAPLLVGWAVPAHTTLLWVGAVVVALVLAATQPGVRRRLATS